MMTPKTDTPEDPFADDPMTRLLCRETPMTLSFGTLLRSRMRVSRAILAARLDLGLSQQEIARRAGTTRGRVSTVEALGGNVCFDTLDRIALALGLEITLVERPDRTPEPSDVR